MRPDQGLFQGHQADEADDGPAHTSVVASLEAAGETGRDLLKVDWDQTPLGPPELWPSSLSTIVRMLVGSRFSMWMAWGPELTFFCNEAYRRDTLGKKYPWALGRPASQVWEEIWPDIGPRIQTVLSTGSATWDESLLLFLERSGYQEETYHTFSYSPLADDRGAIAGMLCVVTEDTERVIGQRRMATLRDLGAEPTAGRDDRTYLRAAAHRLEEDQRTLPFALIYLLDDDGQRAELVGAAGMTPGHRAAPAVMDAADPSPVWPLAEVMDGQTVTMEDLDARFPGLPTGAWEEPPQAAVLLPLRRPVQPARPYGFLVVGVNRYRPLDESYLSFLGLLAAQLASGIASTRAYDAERRRAEQLAELDRAKTAFFTNVSHELRTPLTLLLGPAEDALADDGEIPDRERHRMEVIARNASRLLKLVNTLLDFSRLESGRAQASFEPVELGQYTTELASMFETAVARAGLRFEIDCPPLPEPVYVDREMWAKIVLNLISNALKFTLEGGITVRLGRVDGGVRLSVIDSGIGVPESEQSRLFERFHRVIGARGRTHEGSGIGLALVAELAELHGGRPGVVSHAGSGSTFTVEVPFGTSHLPPEQLTHSSHEISIERQAAGFLAEAERWLGPDDEPSLGDASGAGGNRPRILVVDDNLDMRDYVASLLADEYSVQTAPDGEAALELATADPPDLVLTDVMMPRLDGFGLLAALQSNPDTLHVPVVMLSARAGEDGVIEGLEAGADDYLIKPFGSRELLARVRANLELDRARRTRDELEHSHQMQDQAERLAEVGSWEIEIASGAVRASDHCLRMMGLTRTELQTMSFNEIVSTAVGDADRERVTQIVRDAMEVGEPFEYVRRDTDSGREPRWIRARGEVVRDDAGLPVTIRGFIQDITQRRLAEEAMAASAAAREAAEREHQIADALQRSLLPPNRFQSDHLEVSTYYQAGVAGTQVGGDWYEAIELGAGRTALMIGDVAGRGIRAATVMGQLRAAARAYAQLDLPPAEVLELLDSMVCQLTPGHLATCIYGVYDPVWREFRYANAGHLPPLLTSPGQPVERLATATSPPLGVGAVKYDEFRVKLPGGALITLYTDGLVERRGRDLDTGIDQLAEHIRAGQLPVAEIPGQLVSTFAPEGTEDDIAILVACIGAEDAQQTATIEVPAIPASVSEARRFSITTLRSWGLPEDMLQDTSLITTELVTNAIVHGQPPIRLRLRRTARELAIEVDDAASAMPRKLRAGAGELHGRGLDIVAQLSNRWAARPDGFGKTVWSTMRIRERAPGQTESAPESQPESAPESRPESAPEGRPESAPEGQP